MFKESDFDKIKEYAASIIQLIDNFDFNTISEHEKADLIDDIYQDSNKIEKEIERLMDKVDWDATL